MERVTLKELEQQLLINDKIFVLLVADWCGQCKMLKTSLNKHMSKFINIHFVEIDVESENLWEHKEFNITSVPSILLFKKEELINKIVDYQYEVDLLKILNEFNNLNVN